MEKTYSISKNNAFILLCIVLSVCTKSKLVAQLKGLKTQSFSENIVFKNILAHDDTCMYALFEKKIYANKFELYISKYSVNTKGPIFTVSFGVQSTVTNNPSIDVITLKNDFVILYSTISTGNKYLIAKTISKNGVLSDAKIIDRTIIEDDNLKSVNYKYTKTSSDEILIRNIKKYKSGFQRDKVILINNNLFTVWAKELPKLIISKGYQDVGTDHFIADVDNFKNLYYKVYNYSHYKLLENNNANIRVFTSGEIIKEHFKDTLIKTLVNNKTYTLKFRNEKLNLKKYNPILDTIEDISVYYPFLNSPIITNLPDNSFIAYNLVDIDDEKHLAPPLKALYINRFDANQEKTFDTLFILEPAIQKYLSYNYLELTNRPTNKDFKTILEKVIGDKLIMVFENKMNGQLLELIVCSYNLKLNKLEWIKLLPRKIELRSVDMFDLTVRYFNKTLSVSYYENNKNKNKSINDYRFNKTKILKKSKQKVFINWNIDENGSVIKTMTPNFTKDFLFPNYNTSINESDFFFYSRNFYPFIFLNK